MTVAAGDAVALATATVSLAQAIGFTSARGVAATAMLTAFTVATGLWAMRAQGLWIRRVCAIRVVEIARVTRASGVVGIGLVLADRVGSLSLGLGEPLAIVVTCWMLLVLWRSAVRLWLSGQRKDGKQVRRIVVIGTDRRATELIGVLDADPDRGTRVIGVIGPEQPRGRACTRKVRLAGFDRAVEAIEAADPDGVIISTSELEPAVVNEIVQRQHDAGRTVMLDPGFGGISLRSVHIMPVAYEPLVHVEKLDLARPQLVLKRAAETVLAAVAIVVLSPLLLLLAAAIKFSDRGPVFFKQARVGKDGDVFGVLKFRTMVVDAEARLAQIAAQNQRRGPLFKMDDDPRVTRVGRFLRDSSLDELPQLFNVLLGHMSIVGPRPALPREAERFPPDLRRRQDVKPGITGLWQVEARDNPSFDVYRRLDLYYVQNWSLSLDMVIVLATVEQVIVRLIRLRRRTTSSAEAAHQGVGASAEL